MLEGVGLKQITKCKFSQFTHPHYPEIYVELEKLNLEMKWAGYMPERYTSLKILMMTNSDTDIQINCW